MKAPLLRFDQPAGARKFWRGLISRIPEPAPTPYYLFSAAPVEEALAKLEVLDQGLPVRVRHWLSCKTQPVAALLRWWERKGLGIEVVSEFELLAALREGFAPDRILVNGPAKQRWLTRHPIEGLRVNLDSKQEADALVPVARQARWSLGVRFQTRQEFDPERPDAATQFGMPKEELIPLLKRLKQSGQPVDTIHFHLRTNVKTPGSYREAVLEVAELCQAADFRPRNLDVGGGLPAPHILGRNGVAYAAAFQLTTLRAVYAEILKRFAGLEEVWFENGRFVLAGAGVLVVRILDIKERGDVRLLICDGGRTMNALISTWEEHEIFSIPNRGGRECVSAVCGPTCMAFDQLARRPMSSRLRVGDYLVWMDAGAYHLSWETRFSHGYAAVFWHENDTVTMVRPPESFDEWWGDWR